MTKAIYRIETTEGFVDSPYLTFSASDLGSADADFTFLSVMAKATNLNQAVGSLLFGGANGKRLFNIHAFTTMDHDYEVTCRLTADAGPGQLPTAEGRHFSVRADGVTYDLGTASENAEISKDAVEEALLAIRATPSLTR